MAKSENRFIGVWKLVSIEVRDEQGNVIPGLAGPLGSEPEGTAIFTGERMYCQMMNPDRPKIGDSAGPEDIVLAFRGYYAYGGKYSFDKETSTVTYVVEMALDPAMIGGNEVRTYAFSDGRLILTPPPVVFGDQKFYPALTWERVE